MTYDSVWGALRRTDFEKPLGVQKGLVFLDNASVGLIPASRPEAKGKENCIFIHDGPSPDLVMCVLLWGDGRATRYLTAAPQPSQQPRRGGVLAQGDSDADRPQGLRGAVVGAGEGVWREGRCPGVSAAAGVEERCVICPDAGECARGEG